MIGNSLQSVHIKLEITVMITKSILFAYSFKFFITTFLIKLLFLFVIGTFFTRTNINDVSFAVMVFWKLTSTVGAVNTCFLRRSGLNSECIFTDFTHVLSTTIVVINVFVGSPTNRTNTIKRKIRAMFDWLDFIAGFKSFFEKLFKIQSLNSLFKYRSFVDSEIRIRNHTVSGRRFLFLDQPLDFFSH